MVNTHQHTEQQIQRMKINQIELIDRIKKTVVEDGFAQPVEGLYFIRKSTPMTLTHGLTVPSICIIVQGSKALFLGDNRYVYDPFHYLLTTIKLPCTGQILEASKELPYLGIIVDLPSNLVGSVLAEFDNKLDASHKGDKRAVDVSPLDADLLDVFVRLARLQDTPTKADALLPLIKREIIYSLVFAGQSNRLAHLMTTAGYSQDIAQAIQVLREDFDKAIIMEDLAEELGMSVSSFHHHFKTITAMTPKQFQKRLRLQEARRMMLGEDLDATSAAYHVGYNDASHFGRDYKRLFGDSPVRDIKRLREENLDINY